MKSRITIELDFSNGNQPVIKIDHQPSDDVRDKLIKQFISRLNYISQWCRITFESQNEGGGSCIFIHPIPESDLVKESEYMLAQSKQIAVEEPVSKVFSEKIYIGGDTAFLAPQ